jgi:hypothetical protein
MEDILRPHILKRFQFGDLESRAMSKDYPALCYLQPTFLLFWASIFSFVSGGAREGD